MTALSSHPYEVGILSSPFTELFIFGARGQKSCGKLWAISELSTVTFTYESEFFPLQNCPISIFKFFLWGRSCITRDSTKLLSKGWRSGCPAAGMRGRCRSGTPAALVPASGGQSAAVPSSVFCQNGEQATAWLCRLGEGTWRCDCFINSSSPNFISPQPHFFFQKYTVLPATLGNSILQNQAGFPHAVLLA